MLYGAVTDAGRSGIKECIVALASGFLTGMSEIFREAATHLFFSCTVKVLMGWSEGNVGYFADVGTMIFYLKSDIKTELKERLK